MHTLILDENDIHEMLRQVGIHRLMDTLIEQLQQTFATFDPQSTHTPQRSGFHYVDPSGLIEWMPLHQSGDKVFMKVVGYHPMSPQLKRLPTILSTMSMYDTTTGHLVAIMDGTILTAMRTGAASAVASQLLANPESEVLGLVGCGAQAVTQLHALSRRFDLREVLIYDTNTATAESFASRVSKLVDESTSISLATREEIAARADILCTATSVGVGQGPVISLDRSRPWLHVNAVGSDFPGKTELSRTFLQSSFVCPDFTPQACVEGECQQLSTEHIGPTIVDVTKAAGNYAYVQKQRSVFDSTGWALEDWVAMQLAMKWASQLGLGKRLRLECIPADPSDPYDFLEAISGSSRRAIARPPSGETVG